MVSDQQRFLLSFGVLLFFALLANAQVLIRSGSVLSCQAGQFTCERWQTVGTFLTALVVLYPIAYLFESERERPLFSD